MMNIPMKGEQSYSPLSGKVDVSTFEEAVGRVREYEKELQCLSGVVRVMKEDLQVYELMNPCIDMYL